MKPVRHRALAGEGVTEHEIDVLVAGQTVPGVLWTPASGTAPRALIAMGHGGSSHKKGENIVKRAVRYARDYRWATLAIDAPGHGDRIGREEAERERIRTLARVRGNPIVPAMSVEDKIRYLDDLVSQAVPEWQAALDAVFDAGVVEARTPIAYWGVSMGTSIGIPLLAADDRFACAVLGLSQLHPLHSALRAAAGKVSIPLRFAFQWDDPIRDRDYGLALFDAFGSRERSMHINPGGHLEIPASEDESWDRFFALHLP